MKFHFGELKRRRKSVVIGERPDGSPATIEMEEAPFGLIDRIDSEIPEPTPPPGDFVRDNLGRIIKDAAGKQIRGKNKEDEAYKKAVEQRARLFLFAVAMEMIVPGQVTFETQRESFKKPAAYYKALRKEVEDSPLGHAGVDALVTAALELRKLEQKDVDAARKTLGGEKNGHPTEASPGGISESRRILDSIPLE